VFKGGNMRWLKEEVIILESLVEKFSTMQALRKAAKEKLSNRTWESIRKKVRRLQRVKEVKNGQIILNKGFESETYTMKGKDHLNNSQKKIFKKVKKEPVNLIELSNELGLSKNGVIKLIDGMREKGYDIKMTQTKDRASGESIYVIELEKEPKPSAPIRYEGVSQDKIKILVISDTGFGLKAYQPELVATAFEKAEEQGVDFAIHAGNITGGYATRSTRQDYHTSKLNEQIKYASQMPMVTFKTYFLNGPKDLKHKKMKGKNPARLLAQERKNFRYSGDIEANFHIRGKNVRVIHGKDRSTYAKSYMIQGMKENLQGNVYYVNKEKNNPDLLVVGGVDTFMYLPAKKTGGMEVIGLPALHTMTSSQKTKRRRSGSLSLGYTIVTVNLNEKENAEAFEYEWFPLTAYQTPVGWRGDKDLMSKVLSELEKEVVSLLEQKPHRYGEVSRKLDIPKKKAKKIVSSLRKKGYDIPFDKSQGTISIPFFWSERKFKALSGKNMFDKTIKVASFSDTHIGNRDARLDLIPKVYAIAEKEKVDIITHAGDVCDGMNAYRGHEQELVQHGADEQRKKAVEVWPHSDIPTWIIAGSSHEWVYETRCGHNVVETLARDIPNMEYIGGEKGLEGIKELNGMKVKLFHPKGGLSYAKSYKVQKFINNFIEEIEDTRESVKLFLTGHLHVSFAMIYRGIASFLVPCLEGQTWYLHSKGLHPYLGMWITELTIDTNGNISYMKPKYHSFE